MHYISVAIIRPSIISLTTISWSIISDPVISFTSLDFML